MIHAALFFTKTIAMKNIYAILFSLLLFSCTASKIEYVGSKNAPTHKVDVFVDEKSISKPYEIIGKGFEKASWRGQVNKEKILTLAIEKAKKYGADAVFFKETYILSPGTNISVYSRTDSLPNPFIKGTETRTSTSVTPVTGYWRNEILFLKYK